MKIVIDARTMGSTPSGIGMYLYDFLKELIKNKKFEIILITDISTSKEINYFKENKIKIIEYGQKVSKTVKVLKYFKFIDKKLREINPIVFWEINTIIPIKLKYKGKIITTIHDIFPISHMKYFGLKYRIYFEYFLYKTIKISDTIFYNSRETKENVEKRFPMAKKKQNIVTYISFKNEEKKIEAKDKNYFLYIGNMEKRKGVDILIEAYIKYRLQGGTKDLILAGKMREKSIQKLIYKAKESISGIKYIGYAEKKDELYKNCSAFIFPTRAEGFGMPIIEAISYNKPIIASNLKIFQEIVGNEINYFSLTTSNKSQIDNLVDSLNNYKGFNKEKYKEIVNRYNTQKLIKNIEKELIRIGEINEK